MVAARERSSFVESNRDRGGHGLGDTLETSSFDRPSRAATLEVPETAYDRPQLVGCQPIVCSTAATPDPIVDFDDEFLRQVGKCRMTYAPAGRRLANLF